MNKRIKNKWLKALRSGAYKQAKEGLCFSDGKTDSFCCLGVLTDLYLREKGEGWDDVHNRAYYGQQKREYTFGNGKELLDKRVVNWAGFPKEVQQNNSDISFGLGGSDSLTIKTKSGATLDELNDSGSRFKTIANIIEEDL